MAGNPAGRIRRIGHEIPGWLAEYEEEAEDR